MRWREEGREIVSSSDKKLGERRKGRMEGGSEGRGAGAGALDNDENDATTVLYRYIIMMHDTTTTLQ
jgi:hypothetical protein